jgi:type I restriction enzyme S subunit
MKKLLVGSVRQTLDFKSLSQIVIRIPALKEQEKIGNFLSLFDRLLEKINEKIGLLKELKKGYLQQMFPAKDEKVPRIRFKDDKGNQFPEWDETKLSNIGYFKTSSVDKKIKNGEKIVSLVNYMDVYKHIVLDEKAIDYLMKVSASKTQISENNLLSGDILFTPSSETPNDIGHSSVVYSDLPSTLYSYHLVRFRPNKKLNNKYSHYFCNTENLLNQMAKLSQGATRFTLSLQAFNNISVKISMSVQEQEKIGNFLSSLDNQIANNEIYSNEVESLKKGYMQRLFA